MHLWISTGSLVVKMRCWLAVILEGSKVSGGFWARTLTIGPTASLELPEPEGVDAEDDSEIGGVSMASESLSAMSEVSEISEESDGE